MCIKLKQWKTVKIVLRTQIHLFNQIINKIINNFNKINKYPFKTL